MFITISKDNEQYIEKLKQRGFYQIMIKHNFITLTDVVYHELTKNGLPCKKLFSKYDCTRYICEYCNKSYHCKYIQPHIRRVHLK